MRSDKTCLQRALFAIVLCVFAHGLTCASAQAQNLIDVPGQLHGITRSERDKLGRFITHLGMAK